LKTLLERTLGAQDAAAELARDPVSRLHRYADPRDRETAGLVAAAITYGRVESVLLHLDQLLDCFGPSPAAYARAFVRGDDAAFFRRFVHRWTRGADIVELLRRIGRTLRRHGSLESAFAAGLGPADTDVVPALGSFVDELRDPGDGMGEPSRALRALLAHPRDGSACKRAMLWLRWMVRDDGPGGIDPGGWHAVPARLLMVPVDTHIGRIAGYLGLTERKTFGLAMAREITGALRRLDPADPLRYDFALCHLGIAGDCPSRRDTAICARCTLKPACRLWAGDAAEEAA
jgi:uncharacterized protein (TIGR02757 family)